MVVVIVVRPINIRRDENIIILNIIIKIILLLSFIKLRVRRHRIITIIVYCISVFFSSFSQTIRIEIRYKSLGRVLYKKKKNDVFQKEPSNFDEEKTFLRFSNGMRAKPSGSVSR